MPPRRVVLLLFDGVQTLDVAGPIDAFASANALDGAGPAYELVTAALDGRPVRTTAGLAVAADAVADAIGGPVDTIVVPGGRDLREVAPRPELVAAVRELAPRARRVCAVCTGAFVLAEAGLLDGRRATTHWSSCDELARRHPEVLVEPDRIFVADGRFHTSGGVTAGIDLALSLIEDDLGAEAARTVARRLVVFLQRPGGQSQFSERIAAPAVPRSSPVREAVDAIVADPARSHTVPELAAAVAVSERHLTRLFGTHLGMTPARFVERVRVEAARGMLEDGDAKLSSIATATGFSSPEPLRRAFIRQLGVSPSAYRQRFRRV